MGGAAVPSAKARDFNWHHVFSFWSLAPLFLIVATATIFYFPWANAALYRAFGEQVPLLDEETEEVGAFEAGDISYAPIH